MSAVLPETYCDRAMGTLEGTKGWPKSEILLEQTFGGNPNDEEDEVPPHPRAAKGPPVSRAWTRPSRWVRIAQAR